MVGIIYKKKYLTLRGRRLFQAWTSGVGYLGGHTRILPTIPQSLSLPLLG
jgi:hypothetical protein